MVTQKEKYGYFAGILSIIINTVIFVVKLYIGITAHSLAVISDAIHSLSDNISSIFLVAGFHFSSKEADKEHPFGHSRFESIIAIVIAALLFAVGLEILRNGIKAIFNPTVQNFSLFDIIAIIIMLILKEILAQVSFYLGKKVNSDAIIADGYHHRSDVLSTLPIFIVIFFSRGKFIWLDGTVSILIALFIIFISYKIFKKSNNRLLGEPIPQGLINKIKKLVPREKVIYGAHDISLHSYGDIKILTLHLEIEKSINLFKAW